MTDACSTSTATHSETERLFAFLADAGSRRFKSEAEARAVLRQRIPVTFELFEAIAAIGPWIGKSWEIALPEDESGVLYIAGSGVCPAAIPAPDLATPENDEALVFQTLRCVSAAGIDQHLDRIGDALPALKTTGGRRLVEALRARLEREQAEDRFLTRARALLNAALADSRATMKLLAEIGFKAIDERQFVLEYSVTDAAAFIWLAEVDQGRCDMPVARADFLESTDGELTATFRTLNKKGESKQALAEADLVVATVKALVKVELVAPYHMVDGSEDGERDQARLTPNVRKALNVAFQRTRNRIDQVSAMRKKCETFMRTIPPALKPTIERIDALGIKSYCDQLKIEIHDVRVWPNEFRLTEWQKPATIACITFHLHPLMAFALYPAGDRVRMVAGHPLDHDPSLPELGSFAYDDIDGMSLAILKQLADLKNKLR